MRCNFIRTNELSTATTTTIPAGAVAAATENEKQKRIIQKLLTHCIRTHMSTVYALVYHYDVCILLICILCSAVYSK